MNWNIKKKKKNRKNININISTVMQVLYKMCQMIYILVLI